MEIKCINKNGEKLAFFTFFDHSNRNPQITEYHQKVTKYFNIPVNYIPIKYQYINHGQAIESIIKNLYNQIDYFVIWDNDCIPLKENIVDIIYDKIKDKRTVFGNAVNSNHIHQNHQFAAANAFSISSKLYKDLGEPHLADMIKRSDTCEQVTFACQELGYNVCLVYPNSFYELTDEEMKETGNPRFWNLGNGKDYQLKYGLCTQYGDLFYHAGMANIKRGNDLFIQKCQEILGENEKQRKLDAIVISVNCADYLELTLPENIKYFDNYYVGTVATDLETIEICKKHGAIPVICQDPHDINGFKFDKGSCVQECFKQITDRNKWIILLDGDIIVSSELNNLNLNSLNKNTLYGTSRCFAWDYNEYLEYKNGKPIDSFENIPGGWGCGFFMMFWLNAAPIKNVPLDKIYTRGNIETDMRLLDTFHPNRLDVGKLDFKVLHLGGFSLFENGRIDNRGRFDVVKGKKFKEIPNVKELLMKEK